MKKKNSIIGITLLVAMIYTGLIVWWHLYSPQEEFAVQAPGADNRPEGSQRNADEVIIGEFFMKYEDMDSELRGKWTKFRGDDVSNRIKTELPIETEEDFPILWSFHTGEGHAAPAIHNGRVYLLDYNEELSSDALRCFSLETGRELWRRWYRVPMKRNHGFSRTIPAVGDDYVISIGPEGHVMACHPVTGKLLWSLDMQREYSIEIPPWYTGQCPLVDNGALILAPAGETTLMLGVNCTTGEQLWETPNDVGFKMSHSSVMPMSLHGKRTYVYIGVGGVCGVSAEGSDKGALLWSASQWQPSVVAPSPVRLSDNSVLLVAGYGAGGAVLQVEKVGGKWSAAIKEQYKANAGLASEQQTPILLGKLLYSVLPKDGGGNRERLVCYSKDDLHNPLWVSGADERFGLGPYLVINDLLFVFKDTGELFTYAIGNKELKLLKRQVVIEDGADAWGPLAYADGRLMVRDAHTVVCLKVEGKR
ncbi:MAG: PQQ-binding-like beta-propeller repeat protein [Mangrovibacterium sp.]